MKRCGIEVCAVGPDEGVDFGVDFDLVEELQIVERTEKFTGEDGAEIDELLRVIIESHAQSVWRFDLE